MFIKRSYSTKTKKRYYHYQLVESVRMGSVKKHRVIANLGALTDDEIDRLIRSLNKCKTRPYTLQEAKLKHKKLYHYLDCYVVKVIWDRLKLGEVINRYVNYV